MGYPTRIYYTEKDEVLMWDRWQKGESLHSIARHFGRSLFFAWIRADMNVIEAAWFYHDRGIISQEDMKGFRDANCSRVIAPGGRQYWAVEKQYFSTGFRKAIDEWCF